MGYKGQADTFTKVASNFFDLEALDIDGKLIKFSSFKDKKVFLIINVASSCGYTKANYEELVKMDKKYKKSGLQIMAFPCNQFGQQEKNPNQDIKEKMGQKYNVQFQMFSKIDVNGKDTHDVYKFLRKNSNLNNDGKIGVITWNFSIFLVNSEGNVCYYSTKLKNYNSIINEVENLLNNSQNKKTTKINNNKETKNDTKEAQNNSNTMKPVQPKSIYFQFLQDEKEKLSQSHPGYQKSWYQTKAQENYQNITEKQKDQLTKNYEKQKKEYEQKMLSYQEQNPSKPLEKKQQRKKL